MPAGEPFRERWGGRSRDVRWEEVGVEDEGEVADGWGEEGAA